MPDSTLLTLQEQYGLSAGSFLYDYRNKRGLRPPQIITRESMKPYLTPMNSNDSESVIIERRNKITEELAMAKELYETHPDRHKAVPNGNMRSRIFQWEVLLKDVERAISKLNDEVTSGSGKRKLSIDEVQSKRSREDSCENSTEQGEETVPTPRSNSSSDSSGDKDEDTLLTLQKQYGLSAGSFLYDYRNKRGLRPTQIITRVSMKPYLTPMNSNDSESVIIERRNKITEELAMAKELYETHPDRHKAVPNGNMRSRIFQWEVLLKDVERAISKLNDEVTSGSGKRKLSIDEVQSKRSREDSCENSTEQGEETVPTPRSNSSSDSSGDKDEDTLLTLQKQYGLSAGSFLYDYRNKRGLRPTQIITRVSMKPYLTPMNSNDSESVIIERRNKITEELAMAKELYETHPDRHKAVPNGNMRSRIFQWEVLLKDVERAISKLNDEVTSGSGKRKLSIDEVQSKRSREVSCENSTEQGEETVPTSRSNSSSDSSGDKDGV